MIRLFLITFPLYFSIATAIDNEKNIAKVNTDYSTCISISDNKGKHYFLSEIALTPAKRQMGMMFRTEFQESHAMLFIFEKPKTLAFWMKNVKIPLDMLFFNDEGKLNEIKSKVPPCRSEECPTYPTKHDNNQFVLELKSGTAEKLNITIGAVLSGTEKSKDSCLNET